LEEVESERPGSRRFIFRPPAASEQTNNRPQQLNNFGLGPPLETGIPDRGIPPNLETNSYSKALRGPHKSFLAGRHPFPPPLTHTWWGWAKNRCSFATICESGVVTDIPFWPGRPGATN